MMVIWISLKNFKQNVKSPFYLFFLVLFPIVLMLLLGTVFEGMFDNSQSIDEIQILYTVQVPFREDNDIYQQFLYAFSPFISGLKEQGIAALETTNSDEAKKKVESGEYAAFFHFYPEDRTVEGYFNQWRDLEAKIAKTSFQYFIDRYNTIVRVHSENNAFLLESQRDADKIYVETRSLDSDLNQSSMDYYGVTILTMFVLYGAFLSAYGLVEERHRNTLNRLLVSPIKKHSIFLGITTGTFFGQLLQLSVILGIGLFFLNVDYGKNLLVTYSILISACLFSLSFGMFCSCFFRSERALDGFINLLVMSWSFLGGGYFQLPDFPLLRFFSNLSPLHWVNRSLFEYVHTGSLKSAAVVAPSLVLISLLIILYVSLRFNKEQEI
jgi:ABC-2 type transport system permease protein